MEGGLAACKRGGRRSNERTNERKDEGNRASRVKREMEVTSGGAYNCSTTQLLVLRIARSGVPKCFSAVEIPLTLTVLPGVLERTSRLPRLPTPSCTWHGISARFVAETRFPRWILDPVRVKLLMRRSLEYFPIKWNLSIWGNSFTINFNEYSFFLFLITWNLRCV